MSLYQFAAAVDGFNTAQGGEQTVQPLSVAEFDDMMERNAEWLQT